MKVLMICVKKMDKGGIESYVMSLFRHFDHEKIKVDFLVHSNEDGCLEEEIESYGSKIYKLPRLARNPIKYINKLYTILKNGDYDIVHRHATASIMWIDLAVAKAAGVKVRIAHSHNTDWNHRFIHKLGIPLLNYYSTARFACSKKAGKWMYENNNFIVMNNGIDINNFIFKSGVRDQYREKMNFNGKYVVINVARCVPEKNQNWILKIVRELNDENFLFIVVGDGILLEDLKLEIRKSELENKVILLGNRDDVNNLLMASDLFILPSLFEGLPISMIEAQATGIPCIGSSNITDEVLLSKDSKLLPLDIAMWCDALRSYKQKQFDRSLGKNIVLKNNYFIEQTARQMEDFYLGCKQ